ncbi:MAG: hypothetical protein JOY99_17245 [Sphingomonadaceae bacterium]|nr:hypothetical protein [Sphingomonadaceae bacterium]
MRIPPALLRTAAFAALATLAACDNKPTTIVAGPPDDMQAQLNTAKPVELPPAMEASKSYRCKDNSVVYVDWFTGGKQASLRSKKDGSPTVLKADEAGKPLTAAGGYSLTGSSTASSVTVEQPGKGKQSCDA